MNGTSLYLLLLLVSLLSAPGTLRACSCMEIPAPLEALMDADAVFAGTVTKVEAVDDLTLKVFFSVSKVWKGVETREIVVTTAAHSSVCGFSFKVDESYLVYAYRTQTGLDTNLCTRTSPLASADADLAALGDGSVPKP
jgi:hypothetical protein